MDTSRAETASSRAYDHLKKAILSGELPGRTFLTEVGVAQELEISRTPVREALLRLRAEGLVELFPKKGALVLPVSVSEMRDVFEARQLIEEWAAGRAWATRHTLVAPLRAIVDTMVAERKAGNSSAFAEADRKFHELIVEAAGNAVIARQYCHLRDKQLIIVAAQMRADNARMASAERGHRELVDLMESGTKAQFVRAARDHVDEAAARAAGR